MRHEGQWTQAKGFSLSMLRAVLSGRGDEILSAWGTSDRLKSLALPGQITRLSGCPISIN